MTYDSVGLYFEMAFRRCHRRRAIRPYSFSRHLHRALPKDLADDIEKLQKRAAQCASFYPSLSYNHVLEASGLSTLYDRCEDISNGLF